MAEHWCKEHQVVFFKKGKMKGYAHPILDENGEPTGDWCNEPDEPKSESKKGDYETSEEKIGRQVSIETQNAYSGVVSLMASGVVKRDDPLGQAAINYATSKLSKWFSQGVPEEVKEEKCTEEQRKNIVAVAKKQGYSNTLAVSIMTRFYKKSSSKELTVGQAEDFLKVLESGKYLEREEPEL